MDDFLRRRETLVESANPLLRARIEQIWAALEEGKKLTFSVHLFSNQCGLTEPERDRFISYLSQYDFAFSEAHLSEIADGIARKFDPPKRRSIRFIDDQKYEASYSGARFIEGVVRADELVDLLKGPEGLALRAGSVCLNSFALPLSGILPGLRSRCDAHLGRDAGRA